MEPLLAWKMLNFPKEAYRFKLTWVLNRDFPIFFMLIPFLNFVLHICVTGNVPSITHLLSRVDSFMLVQGFQNMRMIVFICAKWNTRCSSCRLL
ncbi:ADQ_G0022860.mRNA.1.CDS.1 [Saccharomyces cerevisiae]|nr:ADQ_G0022860.mRNA.1.CDS.1 [Saccharomyces cerevisiae]CAI6698018.1 ADQ_G0022860.mRNA.1.CDS.1 [Saccharomyces cerevisiae]